MSRVVCGCWTTMRARVRLPPVSRALIRPRLPRDGCLPHSFLDFATHSPSDTQRLTSNRPLFHQRTFTRPHFSVPVVSFVLPGQTDYFSLGSLPAPSLSVKHSITHAHIQMGNPSPPNGILQLPPDCIPVLDADDEVGALSVSLSLLSARANERPSTADL